MSGTDPSAGAGISADLEAIGCLGGRPLPVVTAVTAQTSEDGLIDMMPVPAGLIEAQFAAAGRECGLDSGTAAAKVGMLADADSIGTAAGLLSSPRLRARIVDPVCGPTAGERRWADEGWRRAFLRLMPPVCDLLTPNLAEARLLAGLPESADAARIASALLESGFRRLLITDSHPDDAASATDAFFSCQDGEGFTATAARSGSPGGMRGSGCRLAAAIAASVGAHPGAAGIAFAEEIITGKMLVSARCRGQSRPAAGLLAQVQTGIRPPPAGFPPLERPLDVCPITDDPARIGLYASQGFSSAQLRIKDRSEEQVAAAAAAAAAAAGGRLRLFINDHWRQAAAIEGVHGVHLGQQDLDAADLDLIAAAGLRLGVSAHGFFELARARSLRPSYVSLGPVLSPNGKNLPALGMTRLSQLLAVPEIPPTVAIGGIGPDHLAGLRRAGIDAVACMQATSESSDAALMLAAWERAAAA